MRVAHGLGHAGNQEMRLRVLGIRLQGGVGRAFRTVRIPRPQPIGPERDPDVVRRDVRIRQGLRHIVGGLFGVVPALRNHRGPEQDFGGVPRGLEAGLDHGPGRVPIPDVDRLFNVVADVGDEHGVGIGRKDIGDQNPDGDAQHRDAAGEAQPPKQGAPGLGGMQFVQGPPEPVGLCQRRAEPGHAAMGIGRLHDFAGGFAQPELESGPLPILGLQVDSPLAEVLLEQPSGVQQLQGPLHRLRIDLDQQLFQFVELIPELGCIAEGLGVGVGLCHGGCPVRCGCAIRPAPGPRAEVRGRRG